MKAAAAATSALLLCVGANATTLVPSEKRDPLSGERIPAVEIASYGDYIYGWDSKYDLVFWPFTEDCWICLNPRNGYAAFNDDFETLPDAQKEKLDAWLKANYTPDAPPASHKEKLAWLEKVYAQRDMDDDFWSRFYRLMAYVHADDPEASLAYVRKTIPLLEKKIASTPEGMDRLDALFLLGEYQRRLGDTAKARKFFEQVKNGKYEDRDGTVKTGPPYLAALIQDREKLMEESAAVKPEPEHDAPPPAATVPTMPQPTGEQ